jgi:hypothetical protein
MGRRSTVEKLPADVERLLVMLILDRKLTIDQIKAVIDRSGHTISRSALGRYVQRFTADLKPTAQGAALKAEVLGALLRSGQPKPRVRVKARGVPA